MAIGAYRITRTNGERTPVIDENRNLRIDVIRTTATGGKKKGRPVGANTFQGSVSGYVSGGRYGSTDMNAIQKFPFSSDANSTDVGDLTLVRYYVAGSQSTTSGYAFGGTPGVDRIDKFPFASDDDATDVGNLFVGRWKLVGMCSTTTSYSAGGITSGFAYTNYIDKFPFASDGNATDTANILYSQAISGGNSAQNHGNGYACGGEAGYGSTRYSTIQKFSFASEGDATNAGDLSTTNRGPVASQSSSNHGYSTGAAPSSSNIIDKFTFASDANATDVGDLTSTQQNAIGNSSTTHGYSSNFDDVDKFSFSSDGDATDVADLTPTSIFGGSGQNS